VCFFQNNTVFCVLYYSLTAILRLLPSLCRSTAFIRRFGVAFTFRGAMSFAFGLILDLFGAGG